MEPTKLFYLQLFTPPPEDIVSVLPMDSLTVEKGTQFNALDLPRTVPVALDNSHTQNLNVTWQQGSFNPDVTGVYTLVGTLSSLDTVDNTMEIGGPEYITFEDMIRTVMRVSGAPRAVIPIPPYALRWIAGAYGRILPRSLITSQWFDLLATSKTAHIGNLYRYFGIHPRRFEDTLLTYMRGKRYGMAMLRESFRRRPVRT